MVLCYVCLRNSGEQFIQRFPSKPEQYIIYSLSKVIVTAPNASLLYCIMHDNIIEAVVAGGSYKGNKLFIPRIPIKPTDGTFPFDMIRRQFPLRPCFAIKSDKAQGQTLKKLGSFWTGHFSPMANIMWRKAGLGRKTRLEYCHWTLG